MYLENLGKYLDIKFYKSKSYQDLESNINNYFIKNFKVLFDFELIDYLDYKMLKVYNDKNFLKICSYFNSINKDIQFINNNTLIPKLEEKHNKFLILLFSKNFVDYMDSNIYFKFPQNIILNLDDYFYDLSIRETININTLRKKYYTNNIYFYEFKKLTEKIVLFLSLLNTKKYNKYHFDIDLIVYMLLGHPKFTFLNY